MKDEEKDELEEIEDSDMPEEDYFDDDFFDPEEPTVEVKRKRESKPAKQPDPREKDIELQTRDLGERPDPGNRRMKSSH